MLERRVISAVECIEALRLAGFRVDGRSASGTLLERRGRIVLVPDALALAPGDIDAILDSADLSHFGLMALLSEAPTQPEMPALEG